MSKKGTKQKRYSAEFKISVIMDMREHHLNYNETVRKYWDINRGQEHNYQKLIQRWERIYLISTEQSQIPDKHCKKLLNMV